MGNELQCYHLTPLSQISMDITEFTPYIYSNFEEHGPIWATLWPYAEEKAKMTAIPILLIYHKLVVSVNTHTHTRQSDKNKRKYNMANLLVQFYNILKFKKKRSCSISSLPYREL